MNPQDYITYLFAVTAFFATPPDTSQLLIVSNSITHGLRRSAFTIIGDLTANAIQMCAAAFGLAAAIATSQTAFILIKWLGVTYLVWIGVQLFRNGGADLKGAETGVHASSGRLFKQGFFTSLSNPYAIVFFAALFPQFIEPTSSVYWQVAVLGVTYLIFDGLILVAWGWIGVRAAGRLGSYSTRLVGQVCGGIMIAAAVLLATKNIGPT